LFAVFLPAPDGAGGVDVGEEGCVAELDKVGEGAFCNEAFIEGAGVGCFDEMARRDENQFAIGLQVIQAFIDKKHVEVGAFVVGVGQSLLCCGGDILEAHVGGVGDNGIEAFLAGVGEKVTVVHVDMGVT